MAAKKKTIKPKKQSTAAGQEPQKDTSKKTTQPIVAQVVEIIVEEAPQPSTPTTEEAREPAVASASDLPTSEERELQEASDADVRKESPAPTEREDLPQNESDKIQEKSFDAAQDKQKETVEGLFRKREPEVMPEISTYSDSGSKKSLFFWIVVIIAIALLTSVGLIAVTRGIDGVPFFAASPTPTPTPMPTPTPTPVTMSREDVSIQVLNGGGVAGAATKMKELLQSKGYTVESTGNTDEYTYEETEILVKPGNESTLSLLEEDLKGSYTLGTTAATLSDDVSYDARVIVGKE